MGTRYKTFDSTGIAPNGRLYAGDLNAIQDQKADSSDYSAAISLGTLRVGDSSIALTKYGTAEARISAALRTDGILRAGTGGGAGGGILPAVMTSAERDALAAGFRPKGMAVFNTTNNQWEYNAGTDAAPNWQAFVTGAAPSGAASGDLTGFFPSPQIAAGAIVNADVNAAAGIAYSKLLLTNSIVNADIATAAAIAATKLAGYPTDGTKFLAGDGAWKVPPSGAPSGAAGGDLTGSSYPNPTIAALAVGTTKIADAAITNAKLADNSVLTSKIQDGQVSVTKLANKYDRAYSALFNIAASGVVDVTCTTAVSYSVAPVYLGTIDVSQSTDSTFGQYLHLSILSVSPTQVVFRVHNLASGGGVNNLRIAWISIG